MIFCPDTADKSRKTFVARGYKGTKFGFFDFDSMSSKAIFMSSPHEKPVKSPLAPITR